MTISVRASDGLSREDKRDTKSEPRYTARFERVQRRLMIDGNCNERGVTQALALERPVLGPWSNGIGDAIATGLAKPSRAATA
jgi:hypothetical protein